jgi:phosphoribosyl 1,2-cyclic phosphate phosphodiesterase
MILTFLGTGTSQGIPVAGCSCAVCLSSDPRDNRTRSSVFIEAGIRVLVDTTPEFRIQAIREKIQEIDTVLVTHAHADHIMGFDDLRPYCIKNGGTMPVYASAQTMKSLGDTFHYAFDQENVAFGYVHARPHLVDGPFEIGPLHVTPLPVPHGKVTTFGFLFSESGQKKIAYISDCASIPQEVAEEIAGIPLLIIDGLRQKPHPTHLSISQAVAVAEKVKARRTLLTHLCHLVSHGQQEAELPPGVRIAYDGLKVEL